MRIAFFSPLPPLKSGIADYSATLIEHLRPLAGLDVYGEACPSFDPSQYDAIVYQVGNNPHHGFVYETALRHPGIVVLHEANLHHLIAELTIRRGDWEAYLLEAEYNGGAAALAYAQRVRALEVGPDYEGVPMTRRLLQSAAGVIVHSRFMERQVRAAGFTGPVGVIPHGAWIPQTDGMGYRRRLGLDEAAPLVGIFGFLKPYKRIAEALRALRRVVRLEPRVRMILVGEPHPDFPLRSLIQTLGLEAHVRVLGFQPLADFTGYLAACDIVLNLRYPTVGESSGSLLRALGLGKAVLVSEVGAFAEFPDEICLKVPVGAGEEELIFEYLNLLVARPGLRRALGEKARQYVERECGWPLVARRYAAFLQGEELPSPAPPAAVSPPPEPEYLRSWVSEPEARSYLETHLSRLEKTLSITPPGGPRDRILEMGAYLQITPALKTRLGYGEVRGCYYGEPGRVDRKETVSENGERFECEIDLFDAERDCFPYPDEHFSTVLCCELIEHLSGDPMHLMGEVNRILKPGGHLVLTTPNIVSLRALSAALQGYHPGFFSAYLQPRPGGPVEARHNREYTPREIRQLLEEAGFELVLLETGPFREEPRPEQAWVANLLERYGMPADLRDDGIYAVGRKTGPLRCRYPGWLYA